MTLPARCHQRCDDDIYIMTLPARCHQGSDDDFVLHQFRLAWEVERSTESVDVGTLL